MYSRTAVKLLEVFWRIYMSLKSRHIYSPLSELVTVKYRTMITNS
jgi:hypothetical protein